MILIASDKAMTYNGLDSFKMGLDVLSSLLKHRCMQTVTRFVFTFLACATLMLQNAFAGPEPMAPSYKESKDVMPAPPPPCDWSGIYIGLHAGGEFGHSQTNDLDEWNESAHHHFGYDESGFVAGGQVGYNWQFHWLVLGPEFDIGYMDLDGRGVEPGSPGDDSRGESNSDLYMTFRGRVGFAHDCWLFYATGGVIGVNYESKFIDDCVGGDCGGGLIDARKTEFNWGPTVGGGIERMLGRHWSIKVEYLYFTLDEQSFGNFETETGLLSVSKAGIGAPQGKGSPDFFHFEGETQGHIIRGGLNFKF